MIDPINPLDQTETVIQEQETAREGYWRRVLVATDIYINVLCDGLPDETISSRSARAALAGKWWGTVLSAFLNLFQGDHGACAMAGDVERASQILQIEEATKILDEEQETGS